MTGPAAVIAGLGSCLPERVVTNDELASTLSTSDEWIRTRTGIRQRYVIGSGTGTVELATVAADLALQAAGVPRADAVVLATATPQRLCPASAPEVAARLGMVGAAAFDVSAVCTGFLYALANAAGLIGVGLAETVLVIGADTFSTILDPADRATRTIFGDGAGAVLLRAGASTELGALHAFDLGSDGSQAELIMIPGGGSLQRSTGRPTELTDTYFRMQGRTVFMEAVVRMYESSLACLARAGWDRSEVDRVVAHQANLRILHALADQLALDEKAVVSNIGEVGNTVAASIPLALADAVADGTLCPGHRTLLTAFGGGLTWGSAAVRWADVKSYRSTDSPRTGRLTANDHPITRPWKVSP